jgi:hypothetical protein
MDYQEDGEEYMTKKRTSLNAVLSLPSTQAAPATPETSPAVAAQRSTRRPGIRQQTAYLPNPVYEQLRKLAFEERQRMHHYLLEGLDRVFRDRGLPSVEELTGKTF